MKVWITPILSPDSIRKGQWQKEQPQKTYLRRVKQVLNRGDESYPEMDINSPPPRTNLFPTPDEIEDFVRETLDGLQSHIVDRNKNQYRSNQSGHRGNQIRSGKVGAHSWTHISCDIESAGTHIICIGLTQLCLPSGKIGRTICVWFRKRGGDCWWPSDGSDLRHIVGSLFVLFRDPGVGWVFHNGVTFDVPILEEIGFDIQGDLLDTLVLQHTAYSEMQKGLAFCATLWLWSKNWKVAIKDEEDEKG